MPGISQTIGICGTGKISVTNDLSVDAFNVTNLRLTSAASFASTGPGGSVFGGGNVDCAVFCVGAGTITTFGSIDTAGTVSGFSGSAVTITNAKADDFVLDTAPFNGSQGDKFTGQSCATGNGTADLNANASAGSLAVGNDSSSNQTGAVSYGINADANGINAVALGSNVSANGTGSLALGSDSSASGDGTIALGTRATANGTNVQSFGTRANGNGVNVSAYGAEATANGTNVQSFGTRANGNGVNVSAYGAEATANGTNAQAFGTGAVANGVNVTAIGAGAIAEGFETNSLAIGTEAVATGTDVTALGAGSFASGVSSIALGTNSEAIGEGSLAVGERASSTGTYSSAIGSYSTASGVASTAIGLGASATASRSIALGAGASAVNYNSVAIGANSKTTRNNQVVLGNPKTEVTIPGLSGSGKDILFSKQDGTLLRSPFSYNQVDTALNKTLPKLESASRNLGIAVQSAGAIASAMSAIPEVSMSPDEPVRCGVGTGGYGYQYAFSAGCAWRVVNRFHLNGAVAYTPSIDYEYGNSPSIAGRIGFSFPLGKVSMPANSTELSSDSNNSHFNDYLSDLEENIEKLNGDVLMRDQRIDDLQIQLNALLSSIETGSVALNSESANESIALLIDQIETLKEAKKADELLDKNRDLEVMRLREYASRQDESISRLTKLNKVLRENLEAIMTKLGMIESE